MLTLIIANGRHGRKGAILKPRDDPRHWLQHVEFVQRIARRQSQRILRRLHLMGPCKKPNEKGTSVVAMSNVEAVELLKGASMLCFPLRCMLTQAGQNI